MRNYLFDRPTGGIPAQPQAARPTIYTPHTKKKRRSPLPWLITFAVLIVSLSATLLILYFGDGAMPWDSFAAEEFPSFDNPSASAPGEPALQTTTAPTTIPRAPTGDGTTLVIETAPRSLLTANQIYTKALPSVVSIEAYCEEGYSTGSGVIMSTDGYIVTNYHIIEGSQSAWVYPLTENAGYEAKLVGYAADLDLAVLKVDGRGFIPAEFGSSRSLEVGDTVYALGNPLGYLYGSFTDGIISALARSVNVAGYDMSLIQTTAPLNSGNSGGALLNCYGQVVGITSAKITSGTEVTAEGLGLAIPISDIRGCVNSIIAFGQVITPRIGIYCYATEVKGTPGILVDSVDEGGPAEAAGLLPNDFITAANGIPVGSVEELKDIFYDIGVGGTVELAVVRGVKELTLTMDLIQ